MEITSLASGMHYEGVIKFQNIESTSRFDIENKDESESADNTGKRGKIHLTFKSNIIVDELRGKIQWKFRDMESSTTYTAEGSDFTLLCENEGWTSNFVTIPTVSNHPDLLYKKGTISMVLVINGFDDIWISNIAQFDISAKIMYRVKSVPDNAYKELEKNSYKNQKIIVGEEIQFMAIFGKGISNEMKKYLIIFESDIGTPMIEHYSIKYTNLPVGEVKYKKDGKKNGEEKIDKAGVFEIGNSDNSVTWIVGLANKTIILGEEEPGSPDYYEWNIVLLIQPNSLSNTTAFEEMSAKRRNIKEFFDCLGSDRPQITKPAVVERKNPEGLQMIHPFGIINTLFCSVYYEHFHIKNWISPKALLLYRDNDKYKKTDNFSIKNIDPGTEDKTAFNISNSKVALGLENYEYYLFIDTVEMFCGLKYCGITVSPSEIIPVSEDTSDTGSANSEIKYVKTQDESKVKGFLIKVYPLTQYA